MRGARIAIVMPALLGLAAAPAAPAAPLSSGGVSLERKVEITLDRPDYQPKPMDDRTPLILRLGQVKPAGDGRFTYEFHYLGFEPGTHRLADYLTHPDGSPAVEIGDVPIQVETVLPADHQGELNRFEPRPFPWIGGYRMILGGLGVLWVAGFAGLAWLGRKKPVVAAEALEPPAPSYAERMRPLVEAAAAGELSPAGQAELERLMTGYWREQIARPDQRMNEAMAAMKNHPEAGSLLRALERWLHQPGGATRSQIDTLLAPYRNTAAPVAKEVGA